MPILAGDIIIWWLNPCPPGGIGVVIVSENVQQLAGGIEALRAKTGPLMHLGLDGSGKIIHILWVIFMIVSIINGIWSFTSWCSLYILFSLGMFGLFVLLLWCFWITPSLDLGRPRCLGYHQPPGSPPAWWVRRESPGYAKDTRTRWGASWQIPLAPSQPNLRESPRCYAAWLSNAKHVNVIFMFYHLFNLRDDSMNPQKLRCLSAPFFESLHVDLK